MTTAPSTPPKLSALVVVHNEEAQLDACLESVAFVDELVVVLDNCTDGSKAIAERHGAVLVEGIWPLEGPRRMGGIAACSGDWVLEVDADERVPPAAAAAIRRAIQGAPFGWFSVPLANHIGGRLVRHGWGAYNGVGAKPLLFAKGAKQIGDQPVHPEIILSGKGMALDTPLDHFVDRDFRDMIDRLNRYTSARARYLASTGDAGSLGANLRRMASRFFKAYVGRKGYREGTTGLMLGLFAALYPILSYLKAREILDGPLDAPTPPDAGQGS